jgi:hypothetical protein
MDSSSKDKLRQIRIGKETAEAAGDFITAARLRDEERKLSQRVGIALPAGSGVPREGKFNRKILRSVPWLVVVCLFPLYCLYELFANKVAFCRGGGFVPVASNDILFWVYAVAWAAPLFVILILVIFASKNSVAR